MPLPREIMRLVVILTNIIIDDEIRRYFADENLRVLCVNSIKAEKERLSWKTFAKRLIDFTDNLYKHQ